MPTTHIPDPTETAMRALLYSRVSTDAQERDGTSLETQERACEEVAADRGWRVVRRIRDAASGGALERDGLDELRAALRRGEADVVIAYEVDRLSRSQNHIGILFDEFERAGVRLEFVTERFEDTAVGRFILAARAFIAEVEREKIAERTMRGKEERARSGRIPQAFGRGCYGYTYNPDTGRREIEPFQAAVVRRIFERYATSRSFSAVSNELNDAPASPPSPGGAGTRSRCGARSSTRRTSAARCTAAPGECRCARRARGVARAWWNGPSTSVSRFRARRRRSSTTNSGRACRRS